MTVVRGQRTEVRGQRAEDRDQRSVDRGQRSEVRSQRTNRRRIQKITCKAFMIELHTLVATSSKSIETLNF